MSQEKLFNQPKITGFKKLASDYSKPIAVTIILMVSILVIAYFVAFPKVPIVSAAEIAENSIKWQELQASIDQDVFEKKKLEDSINAKQSEQKKVEEYTKLLRQVFPQGQNLK